jgi:Na+-transporting NADH:ubiquinone oxidoreductase subunit NqrF
MELLGRRGIPVGCRGGGCGVCKVRIDSGEVRTEKMSRQHVSVEDQAAGVVLACRAYPCSDVQLSALDKMARCIERSHARATPAAPNTPNAPRSFFDGLRPPESPT